MPIPLSRPDRRRSALILALIFACLAGCNRQHDSVNPAAGTGQGAQPAKATPVHVKDLKIQGLMQAIFGNKYRPASNDVLAELPDPDNPPHTATYLVAPVATSNLDDQQTVVVTNSTPVDERGNPEITHVAAGLLSLYFLHSQNGQWVLTRKQENFDSLGSFDNIGTPEWTTLGPNHPGLVVLNGGTWQGESIQFMAIYDLSANPVRNLASEPIRLSSDNLGNCEQENQECWEVSGAYKFIPGDKPDGYYDLHMDFTGTKTINSTSKPASSTDIQATARYVFDGKTYRLAEGTNPVPEI